MTHDQIPLFAASTVLPTVPLPARPKLTRKPARAAATHEAPAEALSLPLVTLLTERPLAKRAPTETHLPMSTEQDTTPAPYEADNEPVALRTDRLWQLDGWTARVIKNQDEDGWAVEIHKDGEAAPALVAETTPHTFKSPIRAGAGRSPPPRSSHARARRCDVESGRSVR